MGCQYLPAEHITLVDIVQFFFSIGNLEKFLTVGTVDETLI
jgi:hypothetical protein